MNVDGRTGLYLVVGDPVAQTKSPAMYSDWCKQAGINAVFVPFQVSREGADQVFAALRHVPNLKGLVVTIPFKPLAADICDVITARARAAGAVNVVRVLSDGCWQGDALDGLGCVSGLEAHGVRVGGSSVHLVGAGGAGASVAAALAEAGAARISVTDLDEGRAMTLITRLAPAYPDCLVTMAHPGRFSAEILVNASPSGMHPEDPLPVEPGCLAGRPAVVEMIMQPARTRLVELAEKRGSVVVPGLEVLQGQFGETVHFLGLSDNAGEPVHERRPQ